MTDKIDIKSIFETMVKTFDSSLPNADELWRLWIKNFEQSAAAAGVVDDKEKIKWMFYMGGKNLQTVDDYISHYRKKVNPKSSDSKTYGEFDACKNRLTEYFSGRRNIEKFRSMAQAKDEKFDVFLTRLREHSKVCNFYHDSHDEIKRQIATGAKYLAIRQKAFSGSSIDEIIEYARKVEKEGEMKSKVSTVTNLQKQVGKVHKRIFCVRCGYSAHKGKSSCPATHKTCDYCRTKGHTKNCCLHRILETLHMNALAAQLSKCETHV